MRRFYAAPGHFSGGHVIVGEEETRHLKDVLRLRVGDEIAVFNGAGQEYRCRVAEIGKKTSTAAVLEPITPGAPESPLELVMAVALLKGEKFDLVIQKSVELGVSGLVPLAAARCDVKLADPAKRMERWERIALEATKQCGRATLMRIGEISTPDELFSRQNSGEIALFSERGGVKLALEKPTGSFTAVVGPEGGWDDAELELARLAGVRTVTLGGRILRAETAAISIAAVIQHRIGDLN